MKIDTELAELNVQLDNPEPDLERCKQLVASLKIEFTKLPEMQPGATLTEESIITLTKARDMFERAVGVSVLSKDIYAFLRSVAQLKVYYFDYGAILTPSKSERLVLGLNLLLMLAQSRIAEFHTELELIPEAARSDEYIAFPLELEQYLTEGSYAKLASSRDRAPEVSYCYFMDMLMDTVREEIAASCESAYEELSIDAAKRLLNIETLEDLRAFSSERQWRISGDVVRFDHVEANEQEQAAEESVYEMIHRSVAYAVELERIV